MASDRKILAAAMALSDDLFDTFQKVDKDLLGADRMEVILLALGISAGALIGKSPLPWIEQVEAWNRMSQYALTEGLLSVHKTPDIEELNS